MIEPGRATLSSVLRDAGYRTSVTGKWPLELGEEVIDWNEMVKPGALEVGFDESFIISATTNRVPIVYVKGHTAYSLDEKENTLRVSYRQKISDLPTGPSNPELLRYPADSQHSGTIVNGISRIGWMEADRSAWWEDQQMPYVFAQRSRFFIEDNQGSPFFLFLFRNEALVPRTPHKRYVGRSRLQVKNLLIPALQANGPPWGGKYLAFEGSNRLPFIISWTGQVKEGGQSDDLISQVDLLASLTDLVDIDLSDIAGLDSQTLLSAFVGRGNKGKEYVMQQSPGRLSIRKGK